MSPTAPTPTFHVLVGLTFALSTLLARLGTSWDMQKILSIEGTTTVLLCILFPFSIGAFHRTLWKIVRTLPDAVQMRYRKLEWLPTTLLLATAVGYGRSNPTASYTIFSILVTLAASLIVLGLCLDTPSRKRVLVSNAYVGALFFVSGFAALIYQVVWQRVLFTTFGVNSESVTIIVSVFMFGLGMGALFGGWLQKAFTKHLLLTFLCLEVTIGIFGIFSLDLIKMLGSSPTPSLLDMSLRVYLVLAVPTLLMGATLPVLVTYLQKSVSNLGKTVSLLYSANTLGSAIAAVATVYLIFVYFGQQGAIWVAACFNFATVLMIALRSWHAKEEVENDSPVSKEMHYTLPLWAASLILAVLGYITLSQEILWYRLLGYMTANKPQVFGTMLSAYLMGIALGSMRAKTICETGGNKYHFVTYALVLTTAVFYIATPTISWFSTAVNKDAALCLAYVFVGLTAYLSGGLFPIIVEMGSGAVSEDSSKLSFLYFSNIVGATSGPLVTGFLLLENYTLEQNIYFLTAATAALALTVTFSLKLSRKHMAKTCVLLLGIAVLVQGFHSYLYSNYLERLFYGDKAFKPFLHVHENRTAIIAVEKAKHDIMYGNGIYDGRFNIDPVVNSNMITRTYMLASVHRKPERVLEIGMSTNSWSKVLTMYEPLQHLDVVEINKAYAELFVHYPESHSVMNNSKVRVHYDDGRRWLKNNPSEKYDAIVMNTSFYWRSNATSLLSKEFLEMCKQHLLPGGVIMYNTTGSKDVYYTAAHVFKYVAAIENFVAVSDSPFDMNTTERRENLLQFIGDDKAPVFKRDDASLEVLARLSEQPLPNLRESLLRRKDLLLITDDNMAVEYKR